MGQRNDSAVHIPLEHPYVAPEEVTRRARTFCEQIRSRRTVRMFSTERVEDDAIRSCILAAGAAPSGANQQPWHFAMVSSPDVKAMIRREAEVEEQAFYSCLLYTSPSPRDRG